MAILWKDLKPHRTLLLLSLLLAAAAQLLTLVDPVIFGKIIDRYAGNKYHLSEHELIDGVIYWLCIALGIALFARACKAAQDYTTRKAVARFGMHIFNDGLKQTLRLSFQEFEESRSGTTLAILQKVKTDAERLINAFINVLFSSLVGVGFLIWYSISRNGLLVNASAGATRTLKDLDRQYATAKDRTDAQIESYRKQFTQMDVLVSQMNSTSSYLTQQLSKLGSSKS